MSIKKQVLSMGVNVEIAKRKFIPDPNGPDVGLDGTKGFYGDWDRQEIHNLLTDDGRDFLHEQGYETTGLGSNGANYIGLSSNASAPADGDSSLAGEISSGGLSRSQGTVSHSSGTNSTQIQKTFTATATHTGVRKSGLLTASSAGVLVHEAVFTSVNLENNDQLQVTWTITLDD